MIWHIYSSSNQILTVLNPFYIQRVYSWCPRVFMFIAYNYFGCVDFFLLDREVDVERVWRERAGGNVIQHLTSLT